MFGKDAATEAGLRKHPRLALLVPVMYRVEGAASDAHGQSRDIGGGGMCFESLERLPANAEIRLSFELRPGRRCDAVARIVSSTRLAADRGYKHRVTFAQITDETRNDILNVVFESWRRALLQLG